MLRQDYAPAPVVPKYPPLRGFGYRIPIIPPREQPAPPLAELLGVPEATRSRIPEDLWTERLRQLAVDGNQREGSQQRVPAGNVSAEVPDARRTQLSRRERTEEEKEEIRQEFERLQASTGPNMVVRMEENRVWAILNDRQVVFNIDDDPKHAGKAPFYRYHKSGYDAVHNYNAVIEREARRFGVDPDLVKGIIYIENADGHRGRLDALAQELGRADSLLPMNINPTIWAGIGGVSKQEFADPEKNIRAGVALIRAIQDRIPNPTPAKIGSIWQFTGAEAIRDNGVKIENTIQNKLWEIPPPEDMPGPHVP
jgi:hypothetical protein